jgi:ABC-type dipeptide/oligopeptide/nickel transport system permease subunit
VTVSVMIILGLVVTAILAPVFAPYDPFEIDLTNTLQPPSRQHLLGTDATGRDTLSRVVFGSRVSLLVGFLSVGIAASGGILLGAITGYFGGLVDTVIMRCIDTLMTVPPLILALTFAALLGGGLKNIIIALAISMLPEYTRLMAGLTQHVRRNEYVLAAEVVGSRHERILLIHVLPNCFPTLMVMITLNLGMAIMFESSLSFLGIGVEPPTAAWGSMIYDGYQYLRSNPVLSFAPGLAILLVVLSFNLVGDGLRDAFDPRLRGII